tara:strand:- start:1610 stop:2215 length:606 start_codon:yes stop_codon:yes gene_type:complete
MGTVYTEVAIDTTIECEVSLDEYQIMEMICDDGITFNDLLGYGAIDEDEIVQYLKEIGQTPATAITAKEYLEALTGSTDVKTQLEELKAENLSLKEELNAVLKCKQALVEAVNMLNRITDIAAGKGYWALKGALQEVDAVGVEPLKEAFPLPSMEGMHLVDEDEEDEPVVPWHGVPYPKLDDDEPPTTFKTADELDNEGGA